METEEAAESILEFIKHAYVPNHSYEEVNLDDYPHVDREFYATTQSSLETLGFKYLADIEDKTLASTPGNTLRPVPIRVMTSANGETTAAFYDPKDRSITNRILLFILRKSLNRTIDFETALSDASYICTTNAAAGFEIGLPPMIEAQYLPPKTEVIELLARHEARLEERKERDSVDAVPQRTLDDALQVQRQMDELKAAHRNAIGGLTKSELRKLSFSDSIADDVHDEIQSIKSPKRNHMKNIKIYLNIFWTIIVASFVIYVMRTGDYLDSPDPADFDIEITKVEHRDENLVILGSIRNLSKDNWSSVGIEVEFYDENGVFLDETSGYSASIELIGGNQVEHFKITEPSAMLAIDGYKTTVAKVNRGLKR